jgi:hypothetical protein
MNLSGIIFTIIILIGLHVPCEGLFGSGSLQDYIDNFIDMAKLQLEGVVNLSDPAINKIWTYFKSKYGRIYSSIG